MLINKAEETRLLYSLNTGRPSGAYALMNAHANQMGQPSHGHPTQSLCIATQWGQTLSIFYHPAISQKFPLVIPTKIIDGLLKRWLTSPALKKTVVTLLNLSNTTTIF